jgi:hypothetical protein
MGAATPLFRPPVASLLLFNALVLWAGEPLKTWMLLSAASERNRPEVLSLAQHSVERPCMQLRLRGGRGNIDQDSAPPGLVDWSAGVNSESSEVSDVTGMVSTIFFSSSDGSGHDMSLPQVLPVSDIASRSLDRDFKEFVEDQYLPPLTREWAGGLPRTGRQYLRHVRREAALNYMPVRPLVTKRIIDPRDYVPAALADSFKDSLDSDLASAGDRQGGGAGEVEAGWRAPQGAGGSENVLALKAAEWARNYTESYLLSARGSRQGERTPRVVYSRRLHGPPAPCPIACCSVLRLLERLGLCAFLALPCLARPPCSHAWQISRTPPVGGEGGVAVHAGSCSISARASLHSVCRGGGETGTVASTGVAGLEGALVATLKCGRVWHETWQLTEGAETQGCEGAWRSCARLSPRRDLLPSPCPYPLQDKLLKVDPRMCQS